VRENPVSFRAHLKLHTFWLTNGREVAGASSPIQLSKGLTHRNGLPHRLDRESIDQTRGVAWEDDKFDRSHEEFETIIYRLSFINNAKVSFAVQQIILTSTSRALQ
jgi:hypothetical protein